MIWRTRRTELDLSQRGIIVGILNVTPDSFSDGGRYQNPDIALRRCFELIEEGAEIVDIGGESTRPGALPVLPDEELRRVLPIVRELRRRSDILISIDTSKAEVARHCLDEGADIINDVTALRGDSEMGCIVADAKAGLVLMHMRGSPLTMQEKPEYHNVVEEVRNFLRRQAKAAVSFGIDPMSIVFDPGIGFGKTVAHNVALLAALPLFAQERHPLLIGVSRKSFLSTLSGASSIEGRLWPGVALTSFCRERGARLFRVHEPRPHKQALRMTEAILHASSHG
jgi:dihydropteroate synthase